MYKIDLVRRSVSPATSEESFFFTFPRRCVFLTEGSVVVCELGELSGDPWCRHLGAQEGQAVRRLQELGAGESD
jgi:hypothetical protein